MPQLDTLFDRKGAADPFGGPQCYDATVVASSPTYVVLPGFGMHLYWGPVQGGDGVSVGDRVAISFDEAGTPHLLGGGGGGDGGSSGNVDGGFPDSIYGGTPLVDGNGVTR